MAWTSGPTNPWRNLDSSFQPIQKTSGMAYSKLLLHAFLTPVPTEPGTSEQKMCLWLFCANDADDPTTMNW